MKNFMLYLQLILFTTLGFSQVGIGTQSPNLCSILDVWSETKGILIPRMTSGNRTNLTSPVQGLLVYDTTVELFYFYNNKWTPINVGTISTINDTTYSLSINDNGRVLDFNAVTPITVTVPDNLPIGFQVSITQANTGTITLVGSGGMVLNNRWNGFSTSGQWAKMGLEIRATNSAVVSGEVK